MSQKEAPFMAVFRQSLADAWAGGRGMLMPLATFSLCVILIAITWPDKIDAPVRFIPALFLVIMLIVSLMQTERIFQEDFEDGSLTLWACTDLPLSSLAFAKVLAHWSIGSLPIALIMPLLASFFNWSGVEAIMFAPISAMFGLAVYCLGGTVGALTLATKRNSALIALLVIPISLPLFVYGVGYLREGEVLMLGLFSSATMFTISTTPFLVAGALSIALD